MGLYGCCIPSKELADNLIFTPSPLPQHNHCYPNHPNSLLVHNEKNVSKKEKKYFPRDEASLTRFKTYQTFAISTSSWK